MDSDGTGTKKPFAGQDRSHSTSPSLGGGSRRTKRYSPRSILSISNSWPASMSSSRRISTGRTICPLLDTNVVMTSKISSYLQSVNVHLASCHKTAFRTHSAYNRIAFLCWRRQGFIRQSETLYPASARPVRGHGPRLQIRTLHYAFHLLLASHNTRPPHSTVTTARHCFRNASIH